MLVTNFPLTNNEEFKETFFTFNSLTKVLSIDQKVFPEVDGSENLADKRR